MKHPVESHGERISRSLLRGQAGSYKEIIFPGNERCPEACFGLLHSETFIVTTPLHDAGWFATPEDVKDRAAPFDSISMRGFGKGPVCRAFPSYGIYALISILFGFADSFLGIVTCSNPFSNVAPTLSLS